MHKLPQYKEHVLSFVECGRLRQIMEKSNTDLSNREIDFIIKSVLKNLGGERIE